MPLGTVSRVPSSQDATNKFGNANLTQSIVLPSLSPGYFPGAGSPYSAQSSSWNSPSSSSPLYSSPNPTTSKNFPTSPLRNGSRSANPQPYSVGPASSSRPSLKARAPSQLSKSFSMVEPEEVADMPELPSAQPLTSRKSDVQRPRKLEKRRRSGSLRRRDSKSKERNATSDEDMQEKGKGLAENMPQIHLRHASSQLPLSDSDQSSRTIVPNRAPKSPTAAATTANPPSSFNSNPPTLTRQRSGIRQPGDANHLRPPKDGANHGSGSMGPLSLLASSSENSHGTLAPLIQPSMPSSTLPHTSVASPEPPHGQAAWRPQPSPKPWQGQQPLFTTSADNEVLAFHKAAGNVPKPFKPFAFQFPQRSPVISNASNGRTTGSNNVENGSANTGHFAALVAAAGLSVSPTGSPSPSPMGRSNTPGSNVIGRASNDGLGAMPWRPSTDGLMAFPPRSSTDALNNFGNQESRQSLQSGYSVEVPWESQDGAFTLLCQSHTSSPNNFTGAPPASSPSAFSFSTDLYGYGGPGPASTSNSIDLYRRVDPSTLFPGSTVPPSGLGGVDIEGRHSLSLLGGEPLSPAELDSRGLRMRRFREGHASVSSFAAFGAPAAEDGRSTRTPSWTLEALRENLFGAASAHRRGQESVASSSVGSQSRRSSLSPWNNAPLGVPVGPPALASPRDFNFQFPVSQGPSGLGSAYPSTPWNQQQTSASNYFNQMSDPSNSASESRMKTVVRSFAPLLPDELVLRPGEELAVLQEFDDGWCVVAREGLGSNGAPTPPGLPDPEDAIVPAGDSSSTTGSSTSSRRRVLEVGTCPSWVFDEAASTNGEFARPMRSTSLGITVSMRLPPVPAPHSVLGGSIRESPSSSHVPLASFGQHHSNEPISLNRPIRTTTPIREEVVSWSNF